MVVHACERLSTAENLWEGSTTHTMVLLDILQRGGADYLGMSSTRSRGGGRAAWFTRAVPNIGLQLTAYSLRFAAAFGSS